jgi:hypothetical protein
VVGVGVQKCLISLELPMERFQVARSVRSKVTDKVVHINKSPQEHMNEQYRVVVLMVGVLAAVTRSAVAILMVLVAARENGIVVVW